MTGGTSTALRLSKTQREAALVTLRETFGSPPPEHLLRRAREQARETGSPPPPQQRT